MPFALGIVDRRRLESGADGGIPGPASGKERVKIVSIRVRETKAGDELAIVRLIQELAGTSDESSPITVGYVQKHLTTTSSQVLLAIEDGQAIGLLSYSLRPDLYHAGLSALIEELVVHGPDRGRGVGSALMSELLRRLDRLGCVDLSVATMPDNEGARRFYQAHGLVDEAVLLEKHLS
jgi:ribosomal protein S18 acetylase RimI-like enzyme